MDSSDGQQSWGLDDLEASFDRLEAEIMPQLVRHLATRVELAQRRGVPLRAVKPSPVHGVGRLHFADGLSLLVRAAKPMLLSKIAVAVAQGRTVTLGMCDEVTDGLTIHLLGVAHRPIELVAVGFDQAD